MKKKLEVVELNKQEEKIILEEKQSTLFLLWKKYGRLVFSIGLLVSLIVLVVSFTIPIFNLNSSDHPIIKEVSIDTDLTDSSVTVDPSMPLTENTAKDIFNKNDIFKSDGEVILVKTVSKKRYTIKFFSDYTAIMTTTQGNSVTRINARDEKTYGIKENGYIGSRAETSNVTITNTTNYLWGTVNYFSDGSAEVINSEMDIFVRNAKDIEQNYISNNKVTYLKETKNIKGTKLNYYYDGTIKVEKANKSYLVRTEKDLNISSNSVTFKNNNQASLKETLKLSKGVRVDYYTDGGAIIREGNKTLSVRKSNSIIIKDNKIYEIVDNIYVTVSKTENNRNVIYYTNGSAVIKNYNGKKIYVEENSDIKYQNNRISNVGNNYEELTEERTVNSETVTKFETVAVIETKDYIAIVPKDSIVYDKDGSLKELLTNDIDPENKPITIVNNTNEKLRYRLVIEKSNRTNLDVEYIRYQLSVGNTYVSPRRLDSEIWTNDYIKEELSIKGTNYILLDKVLDPHQTDEIKFMLWTDYETIPNSMQNKYFYGTIRIYAWQEINNNKDNI